ncbi:ribonuclease Z [bacterium]|nr:ribonuclease Z [bacterium]
MIENGNGKDAVDKPAKAVLTPLGSGGWIPVKGRHTACYAFKKGKTLVLLDFGTGITRLIEEHDYLLNGIEKVTGIISHYHIDHIMGLFYLPAFFTNRHLDLYAPGKGLYSKSAKDILENTFQPPQLPRKLADFIPSIEIKDIPMSGMKIDGIDIRFRAQMSHVHPTVAVRIGDHLAYCTDTEPEYETIGFAMGVNVLLHDCWFADKIPADVVTPAQVKDLLGLSGQNGHSSNLAVALLAREAKVRTAVTIHHNPLNSFLEIEKMAIDAAGIAAVEMTYAEDGKSIEC